MLISILLTSFWCSAFADSVQVIQCGSREEMNDPLSTLSRSTAGISIFRNAEGGFSRLIVDWYHDQYDSSRKTYSAQTWFRNGGEYWSEFAEDKFSYQLAIYSIYSETEKGDLKRIIKIDKQSKTYALELFRKFGSNWKFDRFGPSGICREVSEAKPL